MKQNVDAETSELVRRTEERLLLIDEEDKGNERAAEEKKVFNGISVEVPDVYSDVAGKVIGFREFRGRIFVAVLFEVKNGKFLRAGVFDLQTFKDTSPKLLREYLKKKLI